MPKHADREMDAQGTGQPLDFLDAVQGLAHTAAANGKDFTLSNPGLNRPRFYDEGCPPPQGALAIPVG